MGRFPVPTEFQQRIAPGWRSVLDGVLARASAAGSGGVVVFDLDSTLLDNRPRQARIVRELGAERKLAALERCTVEVWQSGWELEGPLLRCGLGAAEVQALLPEARRFWARRFFTSEYCVDDEPVEGAVAFVAALSRAGVQIAYVTGRHEAMRPGTLTALGRCGFPVPGPGVQLWMKPQSRDEDDRFKLDVQPRLRQLGQVLALFDNEPTHLNGYRRGFEQATVVHLATDHSGRPVELLPGIDSVPHF